MAERTYGIPPGSRDDGQYDLRPAAMSTNAHTRRPQARRPQTSTPPGPSPAAAVVVPRSQSRRPVAPYERQSPHQAHDHVRVPVQMPPQSMTTGRRHQPSRSQGQPGYNVASASALAPPPVADSVMDSPPLPDGETRALQAIDRLYGGRLTPPSPEPSYAPLANRVAATSTTSMRHYHLNSTSHSQSSIAPLIGGGGAQTPTRAESRASGWESIRSRAHFGSGGWEDVPIGQVSGADKNYEINHGGGDGNNNNSSDSILRNSLRSDGYLGFDPRDIADDGEDAFDRPSRRHPNPLRAAPVRDSGRKTVVGIAATAGGMGAFASRARRGSYASVSYDGGDAGLSEKSEWLHHQHGDGRRRTWIVVAVIALVVLAAILGGVLGGVVFKKRSSTGSGSSVPGSSEDAKGGLYDINSPQVQGLMNDQDLHKVFPGMDYTPLNAQYPDCLSNPPDQNNITLDVAVLSQLTPAIRLYGTDCNQTQMVLGAIDKLQMNDTVKVWLGVWLGNNQTTNDRQMNSMYDILDAYPSSHFAGVIVGNEVLFSKYLTITQLGAQLQNVRQNLTARNIDLPVATADLGDNWTAALAADSDIVMANVHPFFAGVTPDAAPGWTWNFWQTNDAVLASQASSNSSASGSYPKSIISETGWPSQGGNDCGTDSKCPTSTQGAIAGINELNTFMDGWVCPSLANGTTYFWFEAFDEPWKTRFNDPATGDFWEPHWGLMDVDRKLKDGVKIPDCGGKTVSKPY